MKIYIAGPFFNRVQVDRIENIERLCRENCREFFSPRNYLVLTPKATKEDRSRVFKKNVDEIETADLILANVDDKDTGTLWEMGAAYAFGRSVVGFTVDPKAKINVMLAEGCKGFLRGWSQLDDFLKWDESREIYEGICEYDWDVAKQWENEVE